MREIPLTQGKVTIVDDEDFVTLSQFKWCAIFKSRGLWYAVRNVKLDDGRWSSLHMHDVIMRTKGVDHRDLNGLNNRRSNLRLATQSQNNQNQRLRSDSTSGFKGVCYRQDTDKWMAYISINKNRKYLGCYATAEEAARVYDDAALKLFGEFARLNFQETEN